MSRIARSVLRIVKQELLWLLAAIIVGALAVVVLHGCVPIGMR
jgi:hypothetical protein